MSLITFQPNGIYCQAGDFYIDPWKPVKRAVITHAHADHARTGMKHYLAHHDSVPVMRHRLGNISVQGMKYNETQMINGVAVSLHPAGHIIGSAQVRVEYKGETWVVSGDYKTTADAACVPFEVVKCRHFITESTFGLPVFHWKNEREVFDEINQWWARCRADGVNAVLFAYSLGKAQRIIKGVDEGIGQIVCHGAVQRNNDILRDAGMQLPHTVLAEGSHKKGDFSGELIIAPPGAEGSAWLKRFAPYQTAFASGWMQVRGTRRRRNVDRGFVLSDHADWNGLNSAVSATGAENIYVTHGYSDIFAKHLRGQGLNASVVETEFDASGAMPEEDSTSNNTV